MAATTLPRRRVGSATRRSTLTGLAFCLPWIIGLIAFRAYPIGAAFWYSLTDYQGMNPPEFIGLTNYLSNLRRLGWTDADLADGGSDALIDALAVHGNPAAIARGVTAHLDAGADHVAAQVLNPDPLPALRALAGQLQLTRR